MPRKNICVWLKKWEIHNIPYPALFHGNHKLSNMHHLPRKCESIATPRKTNTGMPKNIVCKKTQIDCPTKPRLWIPVVWHHTLLKKPVPWLQECRDCASLWEVSRVLSSMVHGCFMQDPQTPVLFFWTALYLVVVKYNWTIDQEMHSIGRSHELYL